MTQFQMFELEVMFYMMLWSPACYQDHFMVVLLAERHCIQFY